MKICLIGYGKMGKEIEKIAIERGHDLPLIIDVHNLPELNYANLQDCDVAIDFTIPGSAVNNIMTCFEAGTPVVSGTTGWLKERERVIEACQRYDGTFFYASNFSIGVNLFFELNRKLASLMSVHNRYKPAIKEIHHVHKLDAPSGTAISLAEDIMGFYPDLTGWTLDTPGSNGMLTIVAERTGEVPGTHIVTYDSDIDYISVTHCAKNRKGFATGAVMAAEYCLTHKGILSMRDLLNFK